MNNQRDMNKKIAHAILPIVAFVAMAAGTCPTSKEGEAPCCSSILADPTTAIVWPESNPAKSYTCVQITCDNKDKKPKWCNGPMSETARCEELTDWVTKTYKRFTKVDRDCVLPVVGQPQAQYILCPSTTSSQDGNCKESQG